MFLTELARLQELIPEQLFFFTPINATEPSQNITDSTKPLVKFYRFVDSIATARCNIQSRIIYE
jgi:hypothetical protein